MGPCLVIFIYKSIRDNRQRHFRELEEQKNTNLQTRKTNLLEEASSIGGLVKIPITPCGFSKRFKKNGKLLVRFPKNQIKTLWASYNALVDRFYDQRSIYFELKKELDRKKNLEDQTRVVCLVPSGCWKSD